MGKSSRDIKQIAYEQLRGFFVIALYLWIVFGLLVMFQSVILAEQHIPFAYHGFAIINALALAKASFLVRSPFARGIFSDWPS
jgi:hypothetical protein